MTRLVIASDVDGTLLDENGRLPAPPPQLRNHIRAATGQSPEGCELALASSRTLSELLVLQRALGVTGPCIAEDGAIVAVDRATLGAISPDRLITSGRRTLGVFTLGVDARTLRNDFDDALSKHPVDAVQLAPSDLARLGVHSRTAFRRAIGARRASVLLALGIADADTRELFMRRANATGAQIQPGGRWHTLTRNAGKGAALRFLRQLFNVRLQQRVHFAAIGNEANDASLLCEAEYRFAIRERERGVHSTLASIPNVVALAQSGTDGWIEMTTFLGSRAARQPRTHESSGNSDGDDAHLSPHHPTNPPLITTNRATPTPSKTSAVQ